MTDVYFEEMCNPDKFSCGTGRFTSTEGPIKLTYRKYFNQRSLDVEVDLSLWTSALLKQSKSLMMVIISYGGRNLDN